ncbi:uncharacterized protein LOC120359693 [Solenopsis invicta]|uniref:uncharacterized protein LOC120359693 n=1 Tax=Solenopsis invicta TaxID=13686 RepID=UPI00193CA8BB|nr:uncharacterized protein LOC120359693 [Solenopsis invicta]
MENAISKVLTEIYFRVLTKNQIKLLTGKFKKVPNWDNETIKKALRYKFMCGRSGYEEISRDLPLPSLRTLRRRLENVKFTNGILEEIFDFLYIKVSAFQNNLDKHCMLVLDEMSITPSRSFDISTNSYVGSVELCKNSDTQKFASKALVFMLAGIASRWKQVVAYYFTDNSADGNNFNSIICDIIKKAENIGLQVQSVTSDMGSANMTMWKSFGINVSRHSTIINSCQHPNDKSRKLFFFHDCAHALKNINQGFLKNETITIPDEIVTTFDLPTNIASLAKI